MGSNVGLTKREKEIELGGERKLWPVQFAELLSGSCLIHTFFYRFFTSGNMEKNVTIITDLGKLE